MPYVDCAIVTGEKTSKYTPNSTVSVIPELIASNRKSPATGLDTPACHRHFPSIVNSANLQDHAPELSSPSRLQNDFTLNSVPSQPKHSATNTSSVPIHHTSHRLLLATVFQLDPNLDISLITCSY
ncbi:hypothetical protein KC19_7G141300 [Ceratodon purpureus]|uniref:Uncharacterized protein n=1 Tax=Ceratodon purpureus TaxID=3225 RepID=A0A8T0H6D7_CERPU|nr:hypothetical protein KC19_7G141300 [Ceratodon purpureus]